MVCVHLRRLYQLCRDEKLRLGGSDLIHLICQNCGIQEGCPATFDEHFESKNERFAPRAAVASGNDAV